MSGSRKLAAVLLLATGLCAYAASRSRLAPVLDERAAPLYGLLTARFEGQESVVPPALYLLVYKPKTRRLELVSMPPSRETRRGDGRPRTLADVYGEACLDGKDVSGGGRAMGQAAWSLVREGLGEKSGKLSFWLDWRLPPDARPAFPSEIKRRILDEAGAPLFWAAALARLPRAAAREWTGLGLYDLWLAAAELRRLGPDAVGLSAVPETELLDRFLAYILDREAPGPDAAPATVEILNATETSGLALRATKILRLRGFDVLHFGNTRTLQSAVRVVDRNGRAGEAREILDALGCDGVDVVTKMEARPSTDIQLVLGREFSRCAKL